MKSELLGKSPLLALPIAALFVFIAIFAIVLFLTMRKRARTYDAIASLPLEDDEQTNQQKGGAR
jgi:hypothetical protein